jgi:pimeloyl-ACP methyl ester carboxylesterase
MRAARLAYAAMRFVLVHGAYHGAWCWDRLIPELEAIGHSAVAVDLPNEDPASGAAAYADAIAVAVEGPGDVVVGHSMMGLAIPLVPERVPVAGLVFLCAFIPEAGVSFNEVRAREQVESGHKLQHVQFTDLGEGVWRIGPDTATELFYHDLSQGAAEWATQRLRPQAYRIMDEPSPLGSWPSVPSSYILCRQDRAVDVEWARRVSRERLGVEALEMDGGHSPFLAHPRELAAVLDGLPG